MIDACSQTAWTLATRIKEAVVYLSTGLPFARFVLCFGAGSGSQCSEALPPVRSTRRPATMAERWQLYWMLGFRVSRFRFALAALRRARQPFFRCVPSIRLGRPQDRQAAEGSGHDAVRPLDVTAILSATYRTGAHAASVLLHPFSAHQRVCRYFKPCALHAAPHPLPCYIIAFAVLPPVHSTNSTAAFSPPLRLPTLHHTPLHTPFTPSLLRATHHSPFIATRQAAAYTAASKPCFPDRPCHLAALRAFDAGSFYTATTAQGIELAVPASRYQPARAIMSNRRCLRNAPSPVRVPSNVVPGFRARRIPPLHKLSLSPPTHYHTLLPPSTFSHPAGGGEKRTPPLLVVLDHLPDTAGKRLHHERLGENPHAGPQLAVAENGVLRKAGDEQHF